jgi:hypothetical protein
LWNMFVKTVLHMQLVWLRVNSSVSMYKIWGFRGDGRSYSAELYKIPARVHCTVQVCGLDWRTCTPHHTVASRSFISLTQSPFPFPSTTAGAHPLSATCRAVRLHPYALAGRSSVSLSLRVRSPFPSPSATAAAHPLSATCRAMPLHHLHVCRLSCTHHCTLCAVHGLCTSDIVAFRIWTSCSMVLHPRRLQNQFSVLMFMFWFVKYYTGVPLEGSPDFLRLILVKFGGLR